MLKHIVYLAETYLIQTLDGSQASIVFLQKPLTHTCQTQKTTQNMTRDTKGRHKSHKNSKF